MANSEKQTMSDRILAVLGASRLYVGYIDRAQAMGFKVLVFDRSKEAFGVKRADFFEHIDITDTSGILEACQRWNVLGILAVNDFGLETQAYVAHVMGLCGLQPEVAARCVNKESMRLCWRNVGLPNPYFRKVLTLDEALNAAKEGPGYPYVLKPANSRGGGQRGVSTAFGEKDLLRAFTFAQSAYSDGEVLLEEFLVGSEHTLEAFVWRGEVQVLTISDRFKVRETYCVDKTIVYPSDLPPEVQSDMVEAATQCILAVGIEDGPVHFEFCYTPSGIIPFELGARGGGGVISTHVVPYVTGVDFAGAMIKWVTGEAPGTLSPSRRYSAALRFLTPMLGRLVRIEGLNEVRKESLDVSFFPKLGDKIKEVRIGPDRSGYIVAAAPTRQEALAKADRLESELRITVEPNS